MPTTDVPCVIYAAKSTEDRHGSIPDQLRECRASIEASGTRCVLAEYIDEAVSAFNRDRGQGLVDAMQHAEDLAGEFGTAELWAQHSDRLARGDGRSARHAVEIGLWALKRDVSVRTIQDPDTFRDLLYAVVTGQRNYEDSRRKSLAVSAGHRRAAERGSHRGPRPDGYRVAVEITKDGQIAKRLEFDPERQPMIELIFRLARRRRSTGLIARALNDAGWTTKPNRRGSTPRTWTGYAVYGVLKNPRYAGLATFRREIVGEGQWPSYITQREHHRIRTWLSERPQPIRHRSLETYLLAGLGRCGFCGGPIQQHTGRKRTDGTWARRYVCAGQYGDRCAARCRAPRVDADLVEAMFVAAMPVLFSEDELAVAPIESVPGEILHPSTHPAERQRVIKAARAGDERALDQALERLFMHINPETVMTRQLAAGSRRARQIDVIEQFVKWAKTGIGERSDEARAEARRLNGILRTWLSGVGITMETRSMRIVAHHRASALEPAREVCVSFSRSEWRGFSPAPERLRPPHIHWKDSDIIHAFQRWADANGQAPRSSDWSHGNFEHPNAFTVRKHFTSWARALRAADLKPVNPRAVRVWQDDEIVLALRAWTTQQGRPPRGFEWMRGTRRRPCKTTVYSHFGTWSRALSAAGIEPDL